MTLAERQAAISSGVIEDLSEASEEVRAFAERASDRYLATFVETFLKHGRTTHGQDH